jgi:cyclic pyranopterin phosphate synthase
MEDLSNSLIDRFGRKHDYLRISVTDRCNLRCAYCMPHDNMQWKETEQILTNAEIIRLARIFFSLGVKKIRITGGEPLIRPDIDTLLQDLSGFGHLGLETLALTTNAALLLPKLDFLRQINLNALNISLDTLRRDRFFKITRRDSFDQVWMAVKEALRLRIPALKLNVVLMRDFNDDEILEFSDFAYENFINVRFIEFMPFKDNDWRPEQVIPYVQIKNQIESRYRLELITETKPSVAKDFAMQGGLGTISFITSMTESFCSTCSRLRITADGAIKSCLFFPAEINLRDAMRQGESDAAIIDLIYKSLALKPEAHLPAAEIAANNNRAMIQIGG